MQIEIDESVTGRSDQIGIIHEERRPPVGLDERPEAGQYPVGLVIRQSSEQLVRRNPRDFIGPARLKVAALEPALNCSR